MNNNTQYEKYCHDKAVIANLVKILLFIFIGSCLIILGIKITTILMPFLVGFLMAKITKKISSPLINITRPKIYKKINNTIYMLLFIILSLITIVCCVSLISQIGKVLNNIAHFSSSFDASEFINNITGVLPSSIRDNIRTMLNDNISIFENLALKYFPTLISQILNTILEMFNNIPNAIFAIVCAILSGYYFMNDKAYVENFFKKNIPNESFRTKTFDLINDLSDTLFSVIGGYLLLLVITSVESWIAFYIAGIDYALLLAIIAGIVDFLPVLGISATLLPVAVYCAYHGNYFATIVIIIALAVISIVRRWLEPIVLSKTMKIHPLLMLFGMAAGVYLWGALGFLVGPTVLIIIIQTAKAFSLDKLFLSFLGNVMSSFMKKANDEDNSSDDENNDETISKISNTRKKSPDNSVANTSVSE